MRIRQKSLWGKIGKDGRLSYKSDALEDFCRTHAGKSVIIRVEVCPTEPSDKLTNYFFGYVLRELQEGLVEFGYDYSLEQTFREVQKSCPIFLEEKYRNSSWKVRVKEWDELDVSEAVDVISWVQRWAVENFQIVINDPR